MAQPLWRQMLQPASYNGVPFRVDVDSKQSGRRLVPFEFPKRDVPYVEDMGRRVRRFTVAAYIIYSPTLDPDYESNRDDLIAQLEAAGSGVLILPTGLQMMAGGNSGVVSVDHYSVTEHREKGGFCEFEITFIETGQPTFSQPSVDTQSASLSAASSAVTSFQNSSDIIGL